MSLWDRLLRRAAPSQTIKSSDPYLAEFFGLRSGSWQADVDRDTAAGLPVAYACVQLVAQTLASMPLHLFARTADGGRERQTSHPLSRVLSDMASESVTSFECREYVAASVLISGNGYARITWSGKGQVEALEPLAPQNVTVKKLTTGRLRYHLRNTTGQPETLSQDDMLHIRHRMDSDGIYGSSPITVARAAFNQSVAQHEAAYGHAKAGFRPSGVLSFPNPISDDGKGAALDALEKKASDTSAQDGVLVLDGGAEWKPLAFNSRDAEFLESRKLSDLAIARIFGVPPTAIGIPDHATYSNVEGENRALVSKCLAPMARRMETAMNAALLPPSARPRSYIEHNFDSLTRGDLAARFEAYGTAVQNGILTRNEVRAKENMPAIKGGDNMLTPLNMQEGNPDADME